MAATARAALKQGRICSSLFSRAAQSFSFRRRISTRETETETETETEVQKAFRTGVCFDSRENLDTWRTNAACWKFGKPGNAFIKHSVLENLSKKEVSLSKKEDKRIFYGSCHHRDGPGNGWFTVLSLDDDGKVLPKYEIFPPYPLYTYACSSICNGVFCYEGYVNNEGDEHDVYLYHLWNPATNEVKTLPEAPDHAKILSCHVCFDDKSQDYKVMRLIDHGDRYTCKSWNLEFELYSLKTDSWKKISCAEFCDASIWLRVLINGVFYTTAYRKEGSGEEVILAFDISTETISYLPLHGIIEKKALHLLDYNGMLSILCFVPDGTDRMDYEHWVMSNGSWLKLSVFHTCNVGRPLFFSRNGESLFFRSLTDSQLLVFDSATGKLKHLDDWSSRISHLFPFSESFMKLDGVSGPEFTSRIMSMSKRKKKHEHYLAARAALKQGSVRETTETKADVEKALPTGDALVKHRLVENIMPVSSTVKEKEGDLFHNDNNPIFIGRRRGGHDRFLTAFSLEDEDRFLTAFSLEDDGNLSQKFDLYPPYSEYRFVHSTCFGVFCFISCDCDGRSIMLWNPTTTEFRILPPCDSDAFDYPYTFPRLICEVWVDDKSQDYKVARLNDWYYDTDDYYNYNASPDKLEFLLYSSKTDSWKEIPCPGCLFVGAVGALIDGVCYVSVGHREGVGSVILAFDFSTETVSYIPLPFLNGIRYTILDYNGLLSVISSTERYSDERCDHQHWVMRNGSWCKHSLFHTYNVGVDCHPLGFSRNCESLFFKSTNGRQNQLLVCDCATGKVKHHDHDILELIPYSKSFVKLKINS